MNPLSNLPAIGADNTRLVDGGATGATGAGAIGSGVAGAGTASAGTAGAGAAGAGAAGAGAAFSNSLVNAVGSLAGLQSNADAATAGVATGTGLDIHQAMIAMEQASLGMHLAVQVRDKAVEAYQSLMNMQM